MAGQRLMLVCAAFVVALVGAPPAVAETIHALTTTNLLERFDSSSPGTIDSLVPVSGLNGAESLLTIDFRPATGQLYALSNQNRLYRVDPASGVATQVGSDGAFTLAGGEFGMDFNPTVDRIRVVSDTEQNIRLNPNDGSLTASDNPLAFAMADPNFGTNPSEVAAAYSNNFVGAGSTTLYGIDSGLDILTTQNPPNNGTLNTVGPLGVDTSTVTGLDISPTGAAFALLKGSPSETGTLYTINLTNGIATFVGMIGGSAPIRDIAVQIPAPPPTVTIYALTTGNQLESFDAGLPSALFSTVSISGLQGGESLVTIDFAPASGELYALSNQNRMYRVDRVNGAATQVGSDGAFTLAGGEFGMDFNPVVDRIRSVSDMDQNLRLNPSDGTLTATDGTLAYASGDPNFGADPTDTAIAYSNNFAGAGSTVLYGVDSALDILVIQNPPNAGTLATIGALGVDASIVSGLDISPVGTAFAMLKDSPASVGNLYTVSLFTGATTLVGTIGGSALVRDIAARTGGATAVSIRSFHAAPSAQGVSLSWRTAVETRMLGFNVYRQSRGRLVKLNRSLIPSVFGGTTRGHAYSWLDRNAPRQRPGLRYRLQAVTLDGKQNWIGSATVPD